MKPARFYITLYVFALCACLSQKAHSEVAMPEQFTSSMTSLWQASESCKKAINFTTEYYSRPIEQYLGGLYPRGIPYWVLPQIDKYITDTELCITTLESRLLHYQIAARDFRRAYPAQPTPPVIFARIVRPEDPSAPKERFYIYP